MAPIPLTTANLDLQRHFLHGVPRRPHLEGVPRDILLDSIVPLLDLKDLFSLRRTSKWFYLLTTEPSIWKRLMSVHPHSLHPVPSISRYNLENLTTFEAERLIVRSLSLEKLWRNRNPLAYDLFLRKADFKTRTILNMALLPGGKYLAASVKANAYSYYLMLCVVDHPNGVVPLAQAGPFTSKAYRIQAKYIPFRGEHGILLSFIRRDYKNEKDRSQYPKVDISSYSEDHTIDPEVPLVYECVVLQTSLSSLECLAAKQPGSREYERFAGKLKPPFQMQSLIRSRRALGISDLGEVFGQPYLVLVKQPNTIRFEVIGFRHTKVQRECQRIEGLADKEHRILAVRLLPEQGEVLVVRGILDWYFTQVIERYPVPHFDESGLLASFMPEPLVPLERKITAGNCRKLTAAWITDPLCVVRTDGSVQPEMVEKFSRGPICVYVRTEAQKLPPGTRRRDRLDGFRRIVLWPQMTQRTLRTGEVEEYCEYNFGDNVVSDMVTFEAKGEAWFRILPGCRRSILLSSPVNDISDAPPILKAERVIDEECDLPPGHGMVPGEIFGYLDIPLNFGKNVKWKATAWDDTIGRLCIAPEGSSVVTIVDFAKAPVATGLDICNIHASSWVPTTWIRRIKSGWVQQTCEVEGLTAGLKTFFFIQDWWRKDRTGKGQCV